MDVKADDDFQEKQKIVFKNLEILRINNHSRFNHGKQITKLCVPSLSGILKNLFSFTSMYFISIQKVIFKKLIKLFRRASLDSAKQEGLG